MQNPQIIEGSELVGFVLQKYVFLGAVQEHKLLQLWSAAHTEKWPAMLVASWGTRQHSASVATRDFQAAAVFMLLPHK